MHLPHGYDKYFSEFPLFLSPSLWSHNLKLISSFLRLKTTGGNKQIFHTCLSYISNVAAVVFLFEGEGEENTVIDKVTSVSPEIRRAEEINVSW